MKDKFVLLTNAPLDLFPSITHHVSAVLDRLDVSNLKAEIHTVEEEILQETPQHNAVVDNTNLKEKGSKNSTLLKRNWLRFLPGR